MYGKILVATDGSALADKAVRHGLALATALGATVVIVTVTEMWSALEMSRAEDDGALDAIKTYERVASDRASEVLAAAARQAEDSGVPCETLHVADRKPSDGILDAAGKTGADLIVMATHGRRGMNRVLLGSQTNEVVVRSTIPVLVVR